MFRLPVLLLVLLLCGCSLTVAVPTPTPPPQEAAEALYRAFALQAMVKDVFMEAARLANLGELEGGEAIGMMLLTAGLLQGSDSLLQLTFPEILQSDVERAKAQGLAIATIGQQWFDTQELASAAVPAALDAIDANGELRRYSERLVTLGYSHDDVEMMNIRLRTELEERLGTPTPAP